MRVPRRSKRLLTLCLALVLPGSMAAVVLTGSAATAAHPKASEQCKKVTANIHQPTGTMSGCVSDGPADNPAQGEGVGAGTFPISALTSGSGTITWTGPVGSEYNGTTTDVSQVVATPVGAPGQPVDETETAKCPAGTQEVVVKGVIGPTDRASGDVGGKVKAEVCLNNANGSITLEPGTAVKFGEGPNS
jgi:hypothetical protein